MNILTEPQSYRECFGVLLYSGNLKDMTTLRLAIGLSQVVNVYNARAQDESDTVHTMNEVEVQLHTFLKSASDGRITFPAKESILKITQNHGYKRAPNGNAELRAYPFLAGH
jgi:hypothetical protein